MRDACGFCGPFDLSDSAEMLSEGSKVAFIEAEKESPDELEVFPEQHTEDNEERVDDEERTVPNFPKTPKTIIDEAEARDISEAEKKQKEAEEIETETVPVTNPPTDKALSVELDFDVDPSELYLLLQRRDWEGAIEKARESPEETTHWVSRKEVDGKLRWRLLPIHGAIIFGAPDHVLKALLDVYPGSVSAKDDQGMLPLHLSYRMGSSEAVVDALLTAFPGSVEVQDAKGRTPLVMAQTTKSPNRAAFIKALERHAQATSVSSVQHEKVIAAQRSEFEELVAKLRKQHAEEIEDAKAEQGRLSKEIDRLKEELKDSSEDCLRTKERVELLETRLESKSVGETSVANKVTAMESCLKATLKAKEEVEGRLTRDNKALIEENEEINLKCTTLEREISRLKTEIEEETKKLKSEVTRLEIKLTGKNDELKTISEDHKSVKSYVLILEEQLKKKIAHENSLVEQVASLARQLSVATQDNDSATSNYTLRLRTIEKEREALRQTVSKLSRKLLTVAEYLGNVASEQATIIQRVEEHEIDVLSAHAEHEKIAQSVKAQEELFEQCRVERERISTVLRWEHAALQQSADARADVLAAVEKHALQVKHTSQTRIGIIQNATAMREQLQTILDSVNNYIPAEADQMDENFVDQVLKTVLSAPDSGSDGGSFQVHGSTSEGAEGDRGSDGKEDANVAEVTPNDEGSMSRSIQDEVEQCRTVSYSASALTDEGAGNEHNWNGIEASPSDEPAALKSKTICPPAEVDVKNEDEKASMVE
ncbi:hypothetical protein MPSEU_000411200 [Mayamaea pseudoterrestris]|nr:hypothetical protein MPSEU_000411200 [Mayamaea pseudoterrestris]